jgi:hypothetical protein
MLYYTLQVRLHELSKDVNIGQTWNYTNYSLEIRAQYKEIIGDTDIGFGYVQHYSQSQDKQ